MFNRSYVCWGEVLSVGEEYNVLEEVLCVVEECCELGSSPMF